MSTGVETEGHVDAEAIEAVPLSKCQAKALDEKIRAAGDKLTTSRDQLLDLLEEAARGQIHVGLNIPSWTAWFRDAVQIVPADPAERKALAQLMSGKGMSVRAIAGALGVGKSTVNRDLEAAVPSGTPDNVVGVDGKTYRKLEPKPEPEPPLDVEVVEPEPKPKAEPAPKLEPKEPPITSEFRDEMDNLQINVQAFKDILNDERFPKVRNRLAKRHLDQLNDAIDDLKHVTKVLVGSANVDGVDAK